MKKASGVRITWQGLYVHQSILSLISLCHPSVDRKEALNGCNESVSYYNTGNVYLPPFARLSYLRHVPFLIFSLRYTHYLVDYKNTDECIMHILL